MSAPRKFDEETRARAVRLYTDRLRDHGESKLAARRHVGQLLDIKPATLRNWIEADERAARPSQLRGGDDRGRRSELGVADPRHDRPGVQTGGLSDGLRPVRPGPGGLCKTPGVGNGNSCSEILRNLATRPIR